MTVNDIVMMTMIRPFILGFREPIVICWNSYLALAYGTDPHRFALGAIADAVITGILYCFISAFPVVFIEHHHFNLGQGGLAFVVRI